MGKEHLPDCSLWSRGLVEMLTWLTGHYCSLGVELFLFLEIENDTCVSTVSVFARRIKMPTPISRSLVIAIRKLAENEIFRLARVESLNFMMLSAITRGGDSVY